MCGIQVTKTRQEERFVSLRGPDSADTYIKNDLIFRHHLLSVTGELTRQPFIDGDIVCIFNGEIYNHQYEKSDGEVLIPLYKKHGKDFVKHLEGEWAIALYDFKNDITIHATDIFGTKPLWVNGKECSSYNSGLSGKGKKVPANTIIVNGKPEKIHEFDLNQHKNSYEDWIDAFEGAVKKRWHKDMFIGLSSGYDSGGIDLALRGLDYNKYTIEGQENMDIIKQRGSTIIPYTDGEREFINNNVEPYEFTYRVDGKEVKKMLHSDKAIYGLGEICRRAKKDGKKVYLSGQGADEILCDYSKFPSQSEVKGKFPKDLKIWYNFYNGQQENYLMKEEYIAGAYGIEARYPYLDKQVVQEFLWLKPELKNRAYKAPLDYYLTKHNYPYEQGKKIGFNPVKRTN